MMTFDETVQRTIRHIDAITEDFPDLDPTGRHMVADDIFVDDDTFLYFILDNEYTPDGDETLSEYIDRVFEAVTDHYAV